MSNHYFTILLLLISCCFAFICIFMLLRVLCIQTSCLDNERDSIDIINGTFTPLKI